MLDFQISELPQDKAKHVLWDKFSQRTKRALLLHKITPIARLPTRPTWAQQNSCFPPGKSCKSDCHSPREEILALSLRPGKAATEQNPTPNFQMRKFADFGMPTRNQTWHPFTYHSTEQEMIGVLSAACCNFTQLCTYPPCKQLLTTWQMQLQAY